MKDDPASSESQDAGIESDVIVDEGAIEPSDQQEAELSEAPASENEDAEIPRRYTEEEVSAIRSAEQKQVAEANKAAQDAHRALQQAQQQAQLAELTRQTEGDYNKEIQKVAIREEALVRERQEKFGTDVDVSDIRQTANETRQLRNEQYQAFLTNQRVQADAFVQQVQQVIHTHGLTEADMPKLFQAVDPETTARLIKAERALEAREVAAASAQKAEQDFTPAGPSTGTTTREQLWKEAASGDPTDPKFAQLFNE